MLLAMTATINHSSSLESLGFTCTCCNDNPIAYVLFVLCACLRLPSCSGIFSRICPRQRDPLRHPAADQIGLHEPPPPYRRCARFNLHSATPLPLLTHQIPSSSVPPIPNNPGGATSEHPRASWTNQKQPSLLQTSCQNCLLTWRAFSQSCSTPRGSSTDRLTSGRMRRTCRRRSRTQPPSYVATWE